MSEELTKINNTLTRLCVKVENVQEDIGEMKQERENHKERFWKNMDTLRGSVQTEREQRIESDNNIEKDMTKLKTKVGVIAAGITTGLTAIWQFLTE